MCLRKDRTELTWKRSGERSREPHLNSRPSRRWRSAGGGHEGRHARPAGAPRAATPGACGPTQGDRRGPARRDVGPARDAAEETGSLKSWTGQVSRFSPRRAPRIPWPVVDGEIVALDVAAASTFPFLTATR